MKLYYDMLVPYMPDSKTDAEGNLVQDSRLVAGRRAMMELATFQSTNDLSHLYQSVIFACQYAECDLVDTILGIPADYVIPDGSTISGLMDSAASTLFKSIKPGEENIFDINLFTANVLNVAHALISVSAEQAAQAEPQESSDSGDQISIEEVLNNNEKM